MKKIGEDVSREFLSEHFCYEVEMLHSSLVFLSKFKKESEQSGINLALENFLLHARNLIEFLYFSGSPKKYARACHFLDDESKREILSPNIGLKKFLDRANCEIAHLTYKRYYGAPPEKNWHCEKYFLEIITGVNNFLNFLPKRYRSENIDTLHRKIENIKKEMDICQK